MFTYRSVSYEKKYSSSIIFFGAKNNYCKIFLTNSILPSFFGGMQKMFATHPPMEERVRRLEELAGSRQYRSSDYLDS